MNDYYPMIAAILIGVPLAARLKLNALGSGMFCAGLSVLFALLVQK